MWAGKARVGGFFLTTPPDNPTFLLKIHMGDCLGFFVEIQDKRRNEMEQDLRILVLRAAFTLCLLCVGPMLSASRALSRHMLTTASCEVVSGESLPPPSPHISI